MVDLGHWLEESYRVPDKSLGTDKAEEVVNNSDFDADNLDEESDELFDYQEDDNYE
jgi:endogenous inhibitor of DNA gyrase (YacG/DUF329 family)